ncbi:MAG: nicotinate-nicotinamide nucleotide adenylyltransferase [Chloroflexi bacterium]|nr:MAG: nicotinate-nicotinamide nucleotide adenylyltransferase [Chloroflexota bacterium]
MNTLNQHRETIIYGGAFNPPTIAHQAILQSCVDSAERTSADVWLLPSGDRTDKTIGIDRERRLQLCHALASDVVSRSVTIDVLPTELDTTGNTETIDTVRLLQNQYPDRNFTWVFGSDSVATMADWCEGEWMLDNLPMLVVERPGSPILQLGRYATRLPIDAIEASSTEVRDRLQRGISVRELVPASVLRYL